MEESGHFSPQWNMHLPGTDKPARRWQSLTCALAQLKIRLQLRWCFFAAQNSENVAVWKNISLANCSKPLMGCGMPCCFYGAKKEPQKNTERTTKITKRTKNTWSGFEGDDFGIWTTFFFHFFGFPCWIFQGASPVKWLQMKWDYGSLSLEVGGEHLSLSWS